METEDKGYIHQMASEDRIEGLLRQMTLDEKCALLAGKDTWNTVPIERLGIPSLTMTDGPHGVRASNPETGRKMGPATSFPTGVSMASSWNIELIERVGKALGEETHGMGCDILLGPCVNIVRSPLAGRNFESYSEDPYLAGQIGLAWVKGLQSQGVGASLKHYACNNQEFNRDRGSSEIDERTLREIYLAQFETIVKEAHPWTVMNSYNRINGIYASENHTLLTDILKNEWGFDGVVISDWGATHNTVEPVIAGMDIEMPGPTKYFGSLLVSAVRNWQIPEASVDEAVRRILRMIILSGKMDNPEDLPKGSVNTPEHQALARELAEESIVLLKNQGELLPLNKSEIKSIAVIGPNAAEARYGGGGSSFLEPPYSISPLEGLQKKLGDQLEIHYELGCTNLVFPPLIPPGFFPGGLKAEYFANSTLSGTPAIVLDQPNLDQLWFDSIPAESVSIDNFSVRWSGKLVVSRSGLYTLMLGNLDQCKLFLDGDLILENNQGSKPLDVIWADPISVFSSAQVELEAGKEYTFRGEFDKSSGDKYAAVQLRYLEPAEPEGAGTFERAIDMAKMCDVAIIFAGMPTGFESEGGDRPDMDLPGRQNELIQAIVKANPRTIVVVNAGAPVTMPWIAEVPAVVEAFYPGQEGGSAIANILFGDVNPSGKLSVTFPKRLKDNPAYLNYPGDREVLYGEGIFVGYRYYEMRDVEPLFPFGYGLSYTSFEYSDLALPRYAVRGDPIHVSLKVKNTGQRSGKEVVQLYVKDVKSSLLRPPKELKGFAKVNLDPDESKTVEFLLDDRALSFFDPVEKRWIAESGEFEVLIGASASAIRLRETLELA